MEMVFTNVCDVAPWSGPLSEWNVSTLVGCCLEVICRWQAQDQFRLYLSADGYSGLHNQLRQYENSVKLGEIMQSQQEDNLRLHRLNKTRLTFRDIPPWDSFTPDESDERPVWMQVPFYGPVSLLGDRYLSQSSCSVFILDSPLSS
jgi:hypothetical protein